METRYSISSYVFSFEGAHSRFLTLLRAPGLAHADTWQAVHGLIEPSEPAYRAAYRETLEETGLRPERFFRVELIEQFYGPNDDAFHIVPVFAAYVAGMPRPVLSEEHTAFEWRSPEKAQSRFVWPSQQRAVEIIERSLARWPETGNELFDISACVEGD